MNSKRVHKIINEELTKAQVESMINNKLDSQLNSRDFKKAVKELSGEVVNEIFKLLWQRNNFWMNSATRV
mgnify:FL=1